MIRFALLCSVLGACSWTTFDDLEADTWVTATDKPSNDSSNWGVAIQRGQATGTGGRIVVMGASQSLYSELVIGSDGDVGTPDPDTTLELNSQFGIGNLDPQPILLADPAGNETALVTSSGSASIAVLHGATGNLVVSQVFGPSAADAATYMVPPAPAATMSQTLVAEADKVYGTHYTNPPNPQPSCALRDDANAALSIRALGATPSTGTTTDVIVWAANGKLMRFPPGVFNGIGFNAACSTGLSAAAAATATTAFMPGKGSQVLTFEVDAGRYALLQGHSDTSGFLALYDLTTMTPIGTPRTENGVKNAALMVSGTKRYVVAGFPDAIVDGTSGAGQVQVFEIDTTSGIGSSVMTLSDAQPESKQAFGRAVAVVPFDTKPLIVVGADNEVFTYFRTQLYAETRPGK